MYARCMQLVAENHPAQYSGMVGVQMSISSCQQAQGDTSIYALAVA